MKEYSKPKCKSSLNKAELAAIDRLCWSWHDPVQLERCFKLITNIAAALIGSYGAAVIIIDDNNSSPNIRYFWGLDQNKCAEAIKAVEHTLTQKELVSTNNGFAVVKLSADGDVKGAIAIDLNGRHVNKNVACTLQEIGERTGLAMARAGICEELFERLAIVDGLLEISKAIAEEKELSYALEMIAERAAAAVKAELTAVGLIDWRTKELHYVQSFGKLASKITGARQPLTHSIRTLVNRDGTPVIINDVSADERIPSEAIAEWGVKSLLVVPMKVRKRIIGALMAANRQGGPFAARDLRVFETIANHGAAAIAHAQMHNKAKTALSNLEAEKAKLEAVLSHLGDGVVVCDDEGKVVIMNTAAEIITGLKQSDCIGQYVWNLHPPVFQSEAKRIIQLMGESQPESSAFWEQNIRMPDNKIVRINIRPVFLKNGAFLGTATIMQDITEHVALDEAKSEFVSTVAHELRTPLTALKGSLSLVLGGAKGNVDAGQAELISIAQNNCDRLIRLVDDMLDVAKMETGHLRMEMDIVSVQERVLQAVKHLRHFAEERGIRLAVKIMGKPPNVVGDGDRIEQVATNLIANAIKFSPAGSQVEIKVRQSHGHIRVSVKDEGPGIPADAQKKIFDKFYQLNGHVWKKDGGVGLGLAISKGIVERHGGTINLKSTLGKGSTFTFALPIPGEETLPTENDDD